MPRRLRVAAVLRQENAAADAYVTHLVDVIPADMLAVKNADEPAGCISIRAVAIGDAASGAVGHPAVPIVRPVLEAVLVVLSA